jgi:hypothetical protein
VPDALSLSEQICGLVALSICVTKQCLDHIRVNSVTSQRLCELGFA